MRRTRGFTLVELMVVVALITVVSALAVKSFRKANTKEAVDTLSARIRDAILQASRRAVSTRNVYMLDIKSNTLQWCEWSSGLTTCAGATAAGPLVRAPLDAVISFVATTADIPAMQSATYTAPTRTDIGTGALLYFGRNGTVDSNSANVQNMPSTALTGYTVYVRRANTDETTKRRRIYTYGMSARPRIIDNY